MNEDIKKAAEKLAKALATTQLHLDPEGFLKLAQALVLLDDLLSDDQG